MSRILRLNYPPALVSQPVVFTLIRRFGLSVNILRAQVTGEEGWLVVEVDGDSTAIAQAESWLAEEGIETVQDYSLPPE